MRDKVRERLKTDEGKQKYKKRMYTIEPTFGHMKYNLRYMMFQLRGLEKVSREFKNVLKSLNL